jgi:hypothetical protein
MLERICWILLAIIHLSPFTALFFPNIITRLYSIPVDDPNFAIFHHRAALFGAVVIACTWAVFDPNVRKLSASVTALSMLSFLVIFLIYGQPASLRTIAIVDTFGLSLLAYVGWRALTA